MRAVLVVVVFAGCAQGGASAPGDSNNNGSGQIDAPPQTDAPPQVDAAPMIDATPMVDATPMIDAMIDAPLTPDACVPVITELLVNPGFDNAAIAPWVEVRYNAADGLIVNQSVLGFNAQTPAQYAWIGGYEAPIFATATDAVYQDVTVPALTTQLTVSGYVAAGTADSAVTAYDFAAVVVFLNNNPTGTAILQVNNTNAAALAAWTPFSMNVPSPQTWSGGMLHMQMASSSDDSFQTNFLFDSVSVKATHGCP